MDDYKLALFPTEMTIKSSARGQNLAYMHIHMPTYSNFNVTRTLFSNVHSWYLINKISVLNCEINRYGNFF